MVVQDGRRRESSPVVVEGIGFFGSCDDCVYAIDAATGQEVWQAIPGITLCYLDGSSVNFEEKAPMDTCWRVVKSSVVGIVMMLVIANTSAAAEALPAATGNLAGELESLRQAIADLTAMFPDQYRRGSEFLQRLDAVARRGNEAPKERTKP